MRLLVVDSMQRYRFMIRLAAAARDEFPIAFATSEPLAHFLILRAGFRSVYLRSDRRTAALADDSDWRCDDAIEVLNGRVSSERAGRESAGIVRTIATLLATERIAQCVMWNGQQLVCRAIAHVCAERRVPMKFLEISNLPDKLFADTLGVNARSSIARCPSALDHLPLPDEHQHRDWLARYERDKARPLPQAGTSLHAILQSTVNYGMKLATRGVGRNARDAIVTRPATVDVRHTIAPDADELAARRYVFLPLQVSDDTQLKLHSEVDNLEAIDIALRYAAHEDAALIVKVHPAERNAALVDAVLDLKRRHGFYVATSKTVDLVKHARLVVTINSTVGLEAMLYGKRVVPLGRCFYRSFDRDRLLRYIHAFLIDGVDYFGARAIPAQAARRILSLD
ncbi:MULTISPECIES: capsular biosynthesis protein [Burkholderia]|uniref:Capsular biosynthesis protein n=1 Tax=Burkholderia semiarida TaxID=2843303 RepID=A0ABW7LD18_9BURK|nr:capsular biosynthesis protein [Burkholderia sp. AU32262]MCA8239245.1 capsular biosynthesis protein [Burkholderia sp. AU32262]